MMKKHSIQFPWLQAKVEVVRSTVENILKVFTLYHYMCIVYSVLKLNLILVGNRNYENSFNHNNFLVVLKLNVNHDPGILQK
jgi:hypothetical protein